MTHPTTAPSPVAAYLAALDAALSGAEPAARAEIVAAVREHIDDRLSALGQSPTPADVTAVLTDLGEPDAVAASWFEEGTADAVVARVVQQAEAQRRTDSAARTTGWLMVGCSVAALLLALIPVVGLVLALAALVAAIVVFRSRLRRGPSGALGVAAIVVASIALLLSVVLAAGLLAFSSAGDSSGPSGGSVSVVESEPAS